MSSRSTRRRFLGHAALGSAFAALGDVSFLSGLQPVSAAEAALPADGVRFDAGVEPTVRLLEDTPRNKLLEEVASRIRGGLTYREVLAALLLAGIRNVQPRPSVGFKFHAVLVVNSAHLASLASPPEHRWLPIFWALDYFKDSQQQDVREGDWTMAGVDEKAVPGADKAAAMFVEAMNAWNEPKADAAAAAVARSVEPKEAFRLFTRLGCRDFRDIGHKAIYVANAWRTLEHIGRQHAEPVLRSLAYALLAHRGDPNPATSDLPADRPGRRNLERAKSLPAGWLSGKLSGDATQAMLTAFREGSVDDSCDRAVELIKSGVAPQSIWDAVMPAAVELVMRQQGIVPLHAVTSSNGLHYAFAHVNDDEVKKLLLLQACAFVPMFREAMGRRGKVADLRIDAIEPAATDATGVEAIAAIFADAGRDREAAAAKTLAYLKKGQDPKALIDAARMLVFLKGNNAHDYKFSSALLEDYASLSPPWRDRYLAAGMFYLHGSGGPDNKLVARTRAALG
jgi:hypothetical protein